MTNRKARSPQARIWGQRIRTLRVEHCMTQQDLADAVSAAAGRPLDRTAVTNWETGQNVPALRYRKALAAVLGLPVSILFEQPAEVTAA